MWELWVKDYTAWDGTWYMAKYKESLRLSDLREEFINMSECGYVIEMRYNAKEVL